MTINRNYDILFENQTPTGQIVDFVSSAFELNQVKSEFRKPQLRCHGTLNGGAVKLQTLSPTKNLTTADMAIDSDDWEDTDDEIDEQSINSLFFSNLPHRLKITDLGESADFSAEIIYNAE